MFLDEKTVLEIWLSPGLNFNHLSRNLAQVINRDLKNAGTKLFSWCVANIRVRIV